MQVSTGQYDKQLKMISSVLSGQFAEELRHYSRTQLRSNIDSFLDHEPSTPLIARLWLSALKTRFVPLGFSKMMILAMLRKRALKSWSQHMNNMEAGIVSTAALSRASRRSLRRQKKIS